MSESNVGDYVRTKQKGFQPPQIAKIRSMKRDEGYNNQYYIELDYNLRPDYEYHIYEEDITKVSPRIIDLIEIGDYVNGQLVKHIAYFEGVEEPVKKLIFADEYHLIPTEVCEENEIISIVTKESFKNISYKVGE